MERLPPVVASTSPGEPEAAHTALPERRITSQPAEPWRVWPAVGGGRAAAQLVPEGLLGLGDLLLQLTAQGAAALLQGLVHFFQHLIGEGAGEIAEGHQGVPLGAPAAGQIGEGGEHHRRQKNAQNRAQCVSFHQCFAPPYVSEF